MKKIIIFIFLSSILLSGCGKQNKEEINYESILQQHAKTYYEKHMKGINNQQQAEITLEMLKNANKYGDDFDLSALKNCDDKTTIIINLNDNKEIISYEYELKCN